MPRLIMYVAGWRNPFEFHNSEFLEYPQNDKKIILYLTGIIKPNR